MDNRPVRRAVIWAAVLIFALSLILILTSCEQSYFVNENLRQEANNFNITRRITVINVRNDSILLEMTGTMSINIDADNDLSVTCELPDGTYQKHYIHLNEWVTYVLEDVSNTEVSKYSYELNILPAAKPKVSIVVQD